MTLRACLVWNSRTDLNAVFCARAYVCDLNAQRKDRERRTECTLTALARTAARLLFVYVLLFIFSSKPCTRWTRNKGNTRSSLNRKKIDRLMVVVRRWARYRRLSDDVGGKRETPETKKKKNVDPTHVYIVCCYVRKSSALSGNVQKKKQAFFRGINWSTRSRQGTSVVENFSRSFASNYYRPLSWPVEKLLCAQV